MALWYLTDFDSQYVIQRVTAGAELERPALPPLERERDVNARIQLASQ